MNANIPTTDPAMTPAFALWVDGGIDTCVGDVSLLVAVWEAASAEYLTKNV